MSTVHSSNRSIAMFIDFENLALGFKDRSGRFDIKLVLKRLLEKGKIVAKKAYCDWSRFHSYTASLHESAIELVEIPKRGQTGKNSADIRLCVDAMDLAYSKLHIDTFVIVSGDSDFSPLVSKLKELGKHVIGIGMNASTSALLRDNCDEFIYYEDLVPVDDVTANDQVVHGLPEARRNAFNVLFEALTALRRDEREILGAAMIKNTMCRMHPGFSERQFGYRSFSALLQDAAKEGLLELSLHPKAGTWIVAKFGDEMKVSAPVAREDVARVVVESTPVAAAPVAAAPLTAEQPVQVIRPADGRRQPPRGPYRGNRRPDKRPGEERPAPKAPEVIRAKPVETKEPEAPAPEAPEAVVEVAAAPAAKSRTRRPAGKQSSSNTRRPRRQ